MPVTRVMLEYVHPWPNHAGLFLARHNGGFARAGLDVELISDGYDRGGAPAMLARGEYDVASLRLVRWRAFRRRCNAQSASARIGDHNARDWDLALRGP